MQTLKRSGLAPVNGIDMYYEMHGDGDVPLILIHGGGSTIESCFGNIIPLLASSVKLIAVELQAHGRTSDRDTSESFSQDADDVAALLSHLEVHKANLFGFSNGGSTALQVAIRHPHLINKLVVASGACKRDGFITGFFEGMEHATLEMMPMPLQEAFLKLTPDEDGLQNMFNKDKERMVTFKDWEEEWLNNIKAQAFFISSDRDVVLPEHTLYMSRMVPGSQYAILPGLHGEYIGVAELGEINDHLPAMTATLIKQFLQRQK